MAAQDDATTAVITLNPKAEGTTQVVFRADESDTESTWLADVNWQAVLPLKLDSINIIIDDTAPDITITSPATNPYTAVFATQTIAATATDPISGGVSSGIATFTMNGDPFTGSETVVLTPGLNEFDFVATDNAGNSTPVTLSINYTQAPPTMATYASRAPYLSGNAMTPPMSPEWGAWRANGVVGVWPAVRLWALLIRNMSR